ncbi:hypothetical protein LSM04_001913 [Trypanosoma melophagium]|uniref:uncharacterized protein n=1 Tax=Trypanosoma melophagium TaxID=715481 RepID=UPI003519DF45|nr:hypothetical protein LSM04_001913 [Trypanosoma melophagium]
MTVRERQTTAAVSVAISGSGRRHNSASVVSIDPRNNIYVDEEIDRYIEEMPDNGNNTNNGTKTNNANKGN